MVTPAPEEEVIVEEATPQPTEDSDSSESHEAQQDNMPVLTEDKIEVMDPRPFKERLRNIASGLLDEVKEHLDYMLDIGAIKPSKSARSNTIVLVHKKDGGLRFCINFKKN